MKKVALASLAFALAVCPPLAAGMKYVGVGDSITRGTSWPYTGWKAVFDDENSACTWGGDPDKCGYVPRLEDELQSAGIAATVVNKGIGGEDTPELVSRIDNVLNSTDPDVMILMEGTNDVNKIIREKPGAISLSSVKANLGFAIDEATSRGIDTLLSTIIRRYKDASEPTTANLNGKIVDLGGQKDRPLAKPHKTLCTTTSCFDKNYWDEETEIGHLDSDGYEKITTIFKNVITADAPPSAPTAVSPVDEPTEKKPTYTWTKRSRARWYLLKIGKNSNTLFTKWYEGTDVCGSTNCSAQPNQTLVTGEHWWEVRARNLYDKSNWSTTVYFDAYASAPPAPTANSPSGDIFVDQPTYEWDEANNAIEYRLRVNDGGGTVIDKTYAAASVCGGGTCSATPSTILASGAHSWEVRGSNPAGDGPWSTTLNFEVILLPGATTPIYPSGDIVDTTPVYKWLEAVDATSYRLQVDPPGAPIDETVTAAAACSGGTCEFVPAAALAVGAHGWWVRGINTAGDGPWSAELPFEVMSCDPTDPLVVTAGSYSGTQTFRGCGHMTVESGVEVAADGVVTLHAGGRISFAGEFTVLAGGDLEILTDQ